MANTRHDFREPARTKWGKPGVSYPYGDPRFVRIVENRDTRKDDRGPLPALTPHRNQKAYPGAVLVHQESTPGDDTDKNVTEVYETLPGPLVSSFKEHTPSGIPIVTTEQNVSAFTVYSQLGLFQPSPIAVKSISAGATVTVTLAADHGLPPGAYVTFSGTTSTPPIDGVLQILSVPAGNQVTVKPVFAVTIAQSTQAGTFVSTHLITRELFSTDNANIKKKVESMVAVPDVSAYNEDILCEHPYPYPAYIKGFYFYSEFGSSNTLPFTGLNYRINWGGAPSFPVQEGYRGMSPCRRKRYFFVGPPPDSFASQFTPTVVAPSTGTMAIRGGSKAVSVSFSNIADISVSSSNTWRTAVTPTGLTGPSPEVTNVGQNGVPFTPIGINFVLTAGDEHTNVNPGVQTDSAHGLSVGDSVIISGTGTPLDGVRPVQKVVSSTVFNTYIFGGTSAVTNQGTVTSLGSGEAGIAQAYLDIPESVPPKLVSKLNVASIGTGSNPTVTFSGAHYLQAGQWIRFSGTNCTPSLNGTYAVASIVGGSGSTQVKLVSPPTITVAGTAAGQGQFIITVVDQPQKLEVAGLYEVFVYLIDILYTSGSPP